MTLLGCQSADDKIRQQTPSKSPGPEVETEPPRLSGPSKVCADKITPEAAWVEVAGAPVEGSVRRAYHLCLGRHVALLRLRGTPGPKIAQVVLEQEIYDVHGRRSPRRRQVAVAQVFESGTVRYHRLHWREGRANPGDRGLRVRLHAVDFANGKRWSAPPWPSSPRAIPTAMRPHAPSLHEGVNSTRKSLRTITDALRKKRLKMEKTK